MKILGLKFYDTFTEVLFGEKTYANPEVIVTIPKDHNDTTTLEFNSGGTAYSTHAIENMLSEARRVTALSVGGSTK